MKYFVYIIQNLINYKIYVGKTNNLSLRFADHKNIAKIGFTKGKKTFNLIHKALRKYGEDSFSFQVLEEYEEEQEALEAEKFWIEFFRTDLNRFGSNCGYNLTAGGDGFSSPHSEKTKLKIKNTMLQKIEDPIFKENLISQLKKGKAIKIPIPTLNLTCKIIWPSDIDLLEMVKAASCKAVARVLGVSNIAVRERLKRRNLYPIK